VRQRVEDIAMGAAGYDFSGDEWATAEFLSRFIPALKVQFGMDNEGKDRNDRVCLWFPSNLHHYDNVDTTTEFFFELGVRA
jgi:hypothetical protein